MVLNDEKKRFKAGASKEDYLLLKLSEEVCDAVQVKNPHLNRSNTDLQTCLGTIPEQINIVLRCTHDNVAVLAVTGFCTSAWARQHV